MDKLSELEQAATISRGRTERCLIKFHFNRQHFRFHGNCSRLDRDIREIRLLYSRPIVGKYETMMRPMLKRNVPTFFFFSVVGSPKLR